MCLDRCLRCCSLWLSLFLSHLLLSTNGEQGCAGRKRFCWQGKGFEAICENLLMPLQLAWGDCGFASAFFSCECFIECCSDTPSQPQVVVLWLRLQFPQLCTAGLGALVVWLGQPPSSELIQPHDIKTTGLKGSGLPVDLKVGLSRQALCVCFPGRRIYLLNLFGGGCRAAGVLGSLFYADSATTVPGVRVQLG